ncbi:hypothetical protein BJF93_03775 [Xaviernesmea oryzae]|uniref:Uncharacterized protein n=1 Tax=Xaviernesmea oryzae TaxID=464029 RepID=A0A1Q9AUC1_9HYPH|nr:hypothetical protein [Xaviernesmea oryzae]OLP59055.1 hypothetical protein BJF93_03775 [Xaviernesmea oryzae]SEK88797.1 hypothetical protein SAMN04487976_104290 [Xaviernesmea oryzae]
MNKIVRELYPASKLPEDLREGLPEGAMVRIVIDEVPDAEPHGDATPRTSAELLEHLRKFRASRPHSVSAEEAVARVRALRDPEDTLEAIRRHHASGAKPVSVEEDVRRVRALRDEWEND